LSQTKLVYIYLVYYHYYYLKPMCVLFFCS